MHDRLIAYLDVDNSSVTKLEELEVELEVRSDSRGRSGADPSVPLFAICSGARSLTRVFSTQVTYPNQGCFLMLDYARCSRPQYV